MAHKTQDELAAILADAQQKVEVGGRYAHYKHPELAYEVIGVALMEATEEPAVIYRAEYGAQASFVRPLSSWLDTVEWQGKMVPRFTKLEN